MEKKLYIQPGIKVSTYSNLENIMATSQIGGEGPGIDIGQGEQGEEGDDGPQTNVINVWE
jgi:hypothetical protein